MKLISYQQEYIKRLTTNAIELLNDEYREQGTVVFKAPTGSGKTYMIAQALTKLAKEQSDKSYAFVWLSVNSLHEQSKESLTRYFENERLLECSSLDDIHNNTIEQNEIVFINWDSLIKKNNVFRMDNELNWNLQSVIENTKEDGTEIILIIDESHRTANAEKAKEVIEEINPKLIIEMTATPLKSNGTLIEIPLKRVVAEGMIKSEVQINPNCKNIKENKDLLEIALHKQKYLKQKYNEQGININPLLLIQIPNKKQTDSANPEDYIVGLLADKDITTSNGKLAIRLSGVDIRELDEKIKPNDSDIEVLIFKEAIALGWDCPRASLLFLQREWKQERYNFNIQTLGRIMRMPEQKHYDKSPELNVGYVYSASDNFTIVEELAKDYISDLQMLRDEDLNTKPTVLKSEFIRRKREQTRLSGDFKKCLFETADKLRTKDNINIKVQQIWKSIAIEGKISEIDKEEEQTVEFTGGKKQIKKSREEIASSYVDFCAKMSAPYARSRSTNIIKTAIRGWFKANFNIGDEDKISLIVMQRSNNPHIRTLLEKAKETYANLPIKEEEVIPNYNWEVPENISIFSDYEILENSNKSIIKEDNERKLFIKKNKSGKIELSKPEIKFIEDLENTDDDVLWWFKNGVRESKYFGIAYQKKNKHYYGFYPDFLIRTKQEIIIVEIKDDKDFKPENALKLRAGRNYIDREAKKQKVRFYMLSPMDYHYFFTSLKNQDLDNFNSDYESKLLKYNQSQKKVIENKADQSNKEKEILELLSELDTTIDELKDQKFKNELLKMELDDAKQNIQVISKSLGDNASKQVTNKILNIQKPFNICVLGECSDQALIRKELNNYFEKIGVKTTEWKIEFFNNNKLQNSNILRSLQKGQSKFSIIVTGQIFHHSGKGNTKANILSELKNKKYIPHCIGSNPKDLLTPDKIVEVIDNFIQSENEQ